MTTPCNVNGDAMDYRDLPIKMRLRLGGKVLRKHKVAGILAPESQKRLQTVRLTGKSRFPAFTRTPVSHPTLKKKGLSQPSGCAFFGIMIGRNPPFNGHSTSKP
jgi:hypothetical protein